MVLFEIDFFACDDDDESSGYYYRKDESPLTPDENKSNILTVKMTTSHMTIFQFVKIDHSLALRKSVTGLCIRLETYQAMHWLSYAKL